jgi:hypothetical protein
MEMNELPDDLRRVVEGWKSQLILSEPRSRRSPLHAVALAVGVALGGIVLAAVVAWIAFQVFGRLA